MAALFDAASEGDPDIRFSRGGSEVSDVTALATEDPSAHGSLPYGMPRPPPKKEVFVRDPDAPQPMEGQSYDYLGNHEADAEGDVKPQEEEDGGHRRLCICNKYPHLHPMHDD